MYWGPGELIGGIILSLYSEALLASRLSFPTVLFASSASSKVSFLQDFEALTPNLLARTVETVEGGGLVIILLRTMNSLKQLYTMTMVSPCFFKLDCRGSSQSVFFCFPLRILTEQLQ